VQRSSFLTEAGSQDWVFNTKQMIPLFSLKEFKTFFSQKKRFTIQPKICYKHPNPATEKNVPTSSNDISQQIGND